MQTTGSDSAIQTVENSTSSVNDSVQDSDSVDSGFRTVTGTSDPSVHSDADDIRINSGSYRPTVQPDSTGAQVEVAIGNDSQLSKGNNGLAQDEQLALDVLKYKDKMNEPVDTVLHVPNPDESTDYLRSVDTLNGRLDNSGISEEYMDSTKESEGLDVSAVSNFHHSEFDSSLDEVLYSYRSLPKSAERRQADVTVSLSQNL